ETAVSAAPRPIDTSLFDATVSASDDFYRYVNGGWLDANPVPPEYGSWGAFHEVNERNQELLHRLLQDAAADPGLQRTPRLMVGNYFAAAMDEASIAAAGVGPLRPFLERIDAVASVADVKDISVGLQRYGVGTLHSLGISSDFEDADAYLVYVGQGGLGLPERDYYTRDDERSVELRRAYAAHIAKQLRNLGQPERDAAGAAERILAFETRLAEASYTAEKLRDVQLTMNRFDVSALDELMPDFGLRSYVGALGVTSPTVNIDNPGFFSALDTALAETPVATLKDYLRWHLIRSYASSLAPAFEDEAFDFYGRTLGGQQKLRPRWKRVLDAATSDVGELVAQLYVDATFSEHAKKRCEEMVDHLLSAMGQSIRDADWMTEATKAEALVKLAGFSYKIGYPDRWRDYSGLAIERGAYVENRMRSAAFEYDREVGRLGEPVDKSEWEMAAHSVNAYYHPLLNEVVFPAGILQPPFFYADADDAVNYGAIGAVIGHEITHGFDDRGSQFDAKGSLRNWWTEEDRTEFDRRAQIIVEQFDGYEVADDLHVNGRLTLGENIADLGGLRVAYAALLESLGGTAPLVDGLTPEQRFFLSYASVWRINVTDEYTRLLVNVDPHSPARFRVNGPLANLPAFAAAFGIAEGSPMVRGDELRAHIW
ncbi:MAG TPA: M13 family metallopeptidase, partial [Coriobacteriia bacterium]|nr:M13 family metallopeptidase [Coriobacteriia bacterium]